MSTVKSEATFKPVLSENVIAEMFKAIYDCHTDCKRGAKVAGSLFKSKQLFESTKEAVNEPTNGPIEAPSHKPPRRVIAMWHSAFDSIKRLLNASFGDRNFYKTLGAIGLAPMTLLIVAIAKNDVNLRLWGEGLIALFLIVGYTVWIWCAFASLSSAALYDITIARERSLAEARMINALPVSRSTIGPYNVSHNESQRRRNRNEAKFVLESLIFQKDDFEGWQTALSRAFRPISILVISAVSWSVAKSATGPEHGNSTNSYNTSLGNLNVVIALLVFAVFVVAINAAISYSRRSELGRIIFLLKRVMNEPIDDKETNGEPPSSEQEEWAKTINDGLKPLEESAGEERSQKYEGTKTAVVIKEEPKPGEIV